MITGKAIKVGDDISTDLIISGRYKFAITDMRELSRHLFEDLEEGFVRRITPGKTILVAGKNFAMGSSREQAPLVIKEAGIVAVVAQSFARIFYRNAFNIGLCLLEADTTKIRPGDNLAIDLDKCILNDKTAGLTLTLGSVAPILKTLLVDGGLVMHFKKHRGLRLM
ncbi:MAG: 3-isopropylmalate dehydratase [Candidatus Omnitrophota bacterium]